MGPLLIVAAMMADAMGYTPQLANKQGQNQEKPEQNVVEPHLGGTGSYPPG